MRYLVVIPARGGSKGIKYKNIKLLGDIPLINYTIETFKNVTGFNLDIVVSTDSKKIKDTVNKYYNDIIIIDRPAELATDNARTEPCLVHAKDYMNKKYNKEYDAIITAQITSPLRTVETVEEAIKMFERNFNKNDSLVSVCEINCKFWEEIDNIIVPKIKDIKPRRQDRKSIYYENGLIYITKTESLVDTVHVYGVNPAGFITSELESIDIDTIDDFKLAELLIKTRE